MCDVLFFRRVRFVRYLDSTRLKTSKAKVLLVDFAEYEDVQLWELERTIPTDICKIPPQAVVAKLGDDFLGNNKVILFTITT